LQQKAKALRMGTQFWRILAGFGVSEQEDIGQQMPNGPSDKIAIPFEVSEIEQGGAARPKGVPSRVQCHTPTHFGDPLPQALLYVFGVVEHGLQDAVEGAT
jgi:hypothetical protein